MRRTAGEAALARIAAGMISERRSRLQPYLLAFVTVIVMAGGLIMTFLGVSTQPVTWRFALVGPLMMLNAVVMARSAWRQWLDVRPIPPGQCRCGYNLAGNASGTCPECGRKVAAGDNPA